MKIFYNQNNYFTIYNSRNGKSEEVYDSFENVSQYAQKNDIILLSEQHFIFVQRNYNFYSAKPLTIWEVKELVQRNCIDNKKLNKDIHQLLHYRIDNITINKIEDQFILGRYGQISFDLWCIYSHTLSPYNLDLLQEHGIRILPSSYPTILQINQQFPSKSYNILYIEQQQCKLIVIKKWFYESSHNINIGSRELKEMYNEQQIAHIYRDPNKVNTVTESIVKEISQFFCKQILQWIKDLIEFQTNTVVISELNKNHFAMTALKKCYSDTIWWYIIPNSTSLLENEAWLSIDIVHTIHYLKTRSWILQ